MSKAQDTINIVNADEVTESAVEYGWRDRIPAGMVSLIAGRPGQGKSMLTALMAAEVSQSGRGVIFANAEDGIEKFTVPRLKAAGADLTRVKIIGDGEAFDLPSDSLTLRQMILDHDAALVILDPIASHMGVSLFNDQESRKAMKPLGQIASETGAAIVCIAHLNKATGKNVHPLGAIGGSSGGVVGASRAVYIFGTDPDDPAMRVLAPAKVNFGPASSSLAFDMEESEWTIGEGARATIIRTGKLTFLSDSHKATASDVLKEGRGNGEVSAEKKAVAAEWLTGMLALGAQPVKAIREEAADNGVSWATLRRAADEVGVLKHRRGFGPGSHIEWELPAGHPAIAIAVAAGATQNTGQVTGPAVVPPVIGGDQMSVEEAIDAILAETAEETTEDSGEEA